MAEDPDPIFSGMVPGQLAFVDYTEESDGNETIGQAFPSNPFSMAFDSEKFVWGIVLCSLDNPPEALRPRRLYANDNAIILETIEGLAAYPEEYMQGTQSKSVTICQTIIERGSVERVDYQGGVPVAHYWQHFWKYSSESYEGDFVFTFKVPLEYVMWSGGRIEDIPPPGTSIRKTVHVSINISSSGGTIETTSSVYPFPEPICQTKRSTIIQAGRY